MVIYRKYNTSTASGTHIRIPIPKAGSTDFATGSDWTPATGDVKLSKDGGSQANIGTLPTFSNGAWEFQITGTELSCKQLEVMIVDSATKVIVDQAILIETFGNASAMYQADLSAANLPANVAQWSGTNVASPDTAGYPKVTLKSGTGTGEVSLSSGTVTTGAISANAITATAIASDAITAAKVASDVGAEIADAVWDEATAGHSTAGTTGKALTDAGSAGTPPSAGTIADAVWDEARAGHVGAGSFGESVVLSATQRDAIADAAMVRASSDWEGSAPAKSLGGAVMKLVHKVDSAAGTLTVKMSDNSTTAYTQTETTDAAADPLIGLSGAS